jgi:hypothetical protein
MQPMAVEWRNMMLPMIKDKTFYLNNEPFIMLAGEVHNSSSSSLTYMEEQVWPNIRNLNMNTLLVPVAWETIEPEQDIFDFSIVQGLVEQARGESMHLVILWFGLWKNGESFYVPGWVKKDVKTYFRAQKYNGEMLNTISPFCDKAVERDAFAYQKLLKFIQSIDEQNNTIIMMQVENEIGLLGTERDYCVVAEEFYQKDIPRSVADLYQLSGTWQQCFGKDAGEYMMCYAFASAVEKIAAAGKAAYNLPCYTNAWLEQWPWEAGSYPSGGPVAKMHKLWKAVALSLDCLAPDIYVSYVCDVIDEYAKDNNTLLIPEIRKDAMASTYVLYSILGKDAICYSPFGIEDLCGNQDMREIPPLTILQELNIEPSAFNIEGSDEIYSDIYAFIENIKPLYYQYRNTSHLNSFVKRSNYHYGDILEFEQYRIKVKYKQNESGKPISGGCIIELTNDKFLICGMRYQIEILPPVAQHKKIGVLQLAEVKVKNGEIIRGRVLNGDEVMNISLGNRLDCLLLEIYEY